MQGFIVPGCAFDNLKNEFQVLSKCQTCFYFNLMLTLKFSMGRLTTYISPVAKTLLADLTILLLGPVIELPPCLLRLTI